MSKTHASSHFDHVLLLLKKRKRMFLVSRDTLQGLVDEMTDAARQLARLEKLQKHRAILCDEVQTLTPEQMARLASAPPGVIQLVPPDAPPAEWTDEEGW